MAATQKIELPALKIEQITLMLIGDSPLIVHAWSEKAKKQMLDKQMKKATSGKEAKNPLHPAFEWNDKAAAHAFRIEQAKYLIRSVEVVVEERPEAKPIRAFVSVVREEDRSYTSVSDALSAPDLRQQVLTTALRELVAWRDRYAELVELATVFAAIDEARAA